LDARVKTVEAIEWADLVDPLSPRDKVEGSLFSGGSHARARDFLRK
jgi:hypothetical protein